jgi:hypothetical protein
MRDAIVLPGDVVEALGNHARIHTGRIGWRGGGHRFDREGRAFLARGEVVREHQIVVLRAPMIMLVVGDLQGSARPFASRTTT